MTSLLADTRASTATEPAAAPDDAPERSLLARNLAIVAGPLAVYAASRLMVLLAALVATVARPGSTVVGLLTNWDGGWYRTIMADGYPSTLVEEGGRTLQNPIAFFPLYPLTARWLSAALPLSDAVAAIVTSLLFGAVAVVALTFLARALTDERTARRAATLFAFFPGSLALSMAYTEGVYAALAGICLLALVRRHWVLAGAVAGLATASRPHALVLVLACACQAGVALWQRREWNALWAPALAPTGIVAYFGYLWAHTGDPWIWFHVEREGWHTEIAGGSPIDMVATFLRWPFDEPYTTVAGLGFVFAVAAVAVLVRRNWATFLTVYTVALLFISATSRNDGIRPRDILTALPIFIALGRFEGQVHATLVGVFAAALALATVYHGLPGAIAP